MKRTARCLMIPIAAVAAASMLMVSRAEASENEGTIASPAVWRTIQFDAASEPEPASRLTIDWTRTAGHLTPAPSPRIRVNVRDTPHPHGRRSRARKIVRMIFGAFAGSVVGFYGGAMIGAAVSGDCNGCDDPYFPGVVIGAIIGCPIGAVAGAMLSR